MTFVVPGFSRAVLQIAQLESDTVDSDGGVVRDYQAPHSCFPRGAVLERFRARLDGRF